MKNAEKVSVIIPVYNAEAYLPACIESVTGQTYDNLEILLVDDGSADESQRVCHRYAEKDSRIVVISQENSGVSAARNAGLCRATGDYITFVDSDDELCANAVEFLMQDARTYGADMVSAVKSTVLVDGTEKSPYEDGKISVFSGETPLIRSLQYDRQTNSACAKLFSRELLQNVRFAEGHHVNEDGYFLFLCYTKKPVVVQHNVSIYRYYVREKSSTRGGFSDKYFDMLYFSDLKMQYIRDNCPSLMDYAKDMEVSTHLFFLEVLCRTNSPQYREAERKSVRIVRKRFFSYHPINSHERKMAAVVALGMYPAYKAVFRLKYREYIEESVKNT